MTQVSYNHEPYKFELKCEGHCNHDVCIAVSSLINSIAQYAKNYEVKNFATTNLTTYKYGEVELVVEFKSEKLSKHFMKGIEGLLCGINLYQKNFPDEITVKKK